MVGRIRGIVFPVIYRIFLHMIIYPFLITLSISLRNMESYFDIPLLLINAAFSFLLEPTATDLQDLLSNKPTDTAMTAIAANIEINIKQLLNEAEIPQAHRPEGFYIR